MWNKNKNKNNHLKVSNSETAVHLVNLSKIKQTKIKENLAVRQEGKQHQLHKALAILRNIYSTKASSEKRKWFRHEYWNYSEKWEFTRMSDLECIHIFPFNLWLGSLVCVHARACVHTCCCCCYCCWCCWALCSAYIFWHGVLSTFPFLACWTWWVVSCWLVCREQTCERSYLR